jgi:hypothetical protein
MEGGTMASGNGVKKGWLAAVLVAAAIIVWSSLAPTRRLTQKFFRSLRMQQVQAVNVDLSSLVGPNANPALHQMITQMISDKVKVTVNEKGRRATDAAMASQLAGFHVELLSARKDNPELAVAGEHAFDLTVDRARIQEILKEAGRSELALPESIDGATVAVKIPRSVMLRYGDCPGRPSATANVATPPPNTLQYNDCVRLREGPSPEVNVPQGLDFEKLAEIALEVAGMTPSQAQQFLQTVNWKATLGVSIPRFMRSYEVVKVNGVEGTLLNMAGRRGPTYTLVWAKNGMVYSLTGYGDASNAVTLADSLK